MIGTKNNGFLSVLPTLNYYKRSEIPEKVKESINYISKDDQNYQIYEEILNQIYIRLTTKDKEFHWNLKDYIKFKENYKKINLIDVISHSILKCLNTSNTEIYNELTRLSEMVDWYPEKDRIKDTTTNKYIYKTKEINHIDCYFVIKKLTSQMLSLISRYITKISKETDNLDLEINYILENIDEEFYNFDSEFKYLEDFPLFYDVYVNMKKTTNNQLIKCLQKELVKKKEIENSPINTYIKLRIKEENNNRANFKKTIRAQKR